MEHNALVDVVYVTAFYNIKSTATHSSIINSFEPFLNTNLKILVFTDFEDLSLGNIEKIVLPRANLTSFLQESAALPEYRNKEKDTLEFLQLMNAKPEFLYRAKKHLDAKVYVWFDFGILKIIKNKDQFLKSMALLDQSLIKGKVVIPGCINKDLINYNNLFVYPIWRFCGGLLIVCKSAVDKFHELHLSSLECCRKLESLTWEVNLWSKIEVDNPEIFHWYKADHNDSIMPTIISKSSEKKIIYLTMIKNESAIICRSIESVLALCDAVCVCDTGSTDNTVDVVTEYFKTLSIPCKLYNHTWKNFGHNRTESFNASVDFCKGLGWDSNNTYALVLDADMQLEVRSFDKNTLIKPGYCIIQRAPNMEYYNTRFIQIGFPWKCVGVTHEYWDGFNCEFIPSESIFINDVGDGGCKGDKFERDVRLLEEGLNQEPNNERYLFYLAQSYKDSGRIDDAITYYKKRIDAGGWFEEVWYSMYTIMKLYEEKGDFAQMEMWGMKAYEYRKERAENIYHLVRFFRIRRQYFKAWHYWEIGSVIMKPSADILFIETDVYDRLFEYERTIIHHYVFPNKKYESLKYSVDYYNKYNDISVYHNIKWFVQPLPLKIHETQFEPIGDFTPTSTSFCLRPDGKYVVNVRYVNYRIQPDGSYMMFMNGVLSRNHPVITENYTCVMDSKFNIISPLQKMNINDPVIHNTHIKGLEDVRLFNCDGVVNYIATTLEYSYNGKIRQHAGKYCVQSKSFIENRSLIPPHESDCEKNWIPYKNNFIYKWHPFQIGSLDENKLSIHKEQATPLFFSHMRGSSTLVDDGEFTWGLTHFVIYEQPRKYYHSLVKIDSKNDKIVSYSNPFFFINNAIEYVLGFEKRGDTMYAFVSQNDSDPSLVEFNNHDLVWNYL